ncbi:MAG TPA: hypothetical protein ACFYD6_09670 [Candidatus Brocadiia bacterium]
MLKKVMSAMVVIVSGLLLCNVKIGVAEEDIKKLEERVDAIEGTLGKACSAVEDLQKSLETYRPAYVTEVCEGRVKFGGRVDGFFQYLGGTTRDQFGAVGRLWFDARAKVVPEKVDFIIEFVSAGGKSIGEGLPTNEITIDRVTFVDLNRGPQPGRFANPLTLYKAFAKWKPVKGLQIDCGIADWLNHEDPTGVSGDVGPDNSDVTICEGWSFPSLNVGAWLGLVSELKADTAAMPLLAFRYDPNDMWTFRTSFQTTQTSSMFTTRADDGARDLWSWTTEVVFRPKIFGQQGAYKFFYGLTKSGDSAPVDTATGATLDPSGTNSGVAFLFDQWIGKHFIINARYSVSEDDDIFKSSRNGVRNHWNATCGWISDGDTYSAREFVGVGYGSARWGESYEEAFDTHKREKTLDIFWRHKLVANVWIAPDFQVVWNPMNFRGDKNDETEVIPGVQFWFTF